MLALPGVFTDCYRKDEQRAQKLLTRVSEAWGKTTCLQLALEAKNMNFVSHGGVQVGSQQCSLEEMWPLASVTSTPPSPCSQAFLTKVWWGKLSVDNGLWRVITCMLFFPLLYTNLITFRYLWQLGHACTEAGLSSSLTLRWLGAAAEPTSTPAPSREKRLQPMGCLARLRAFFTAPIVIFLMNILSYFTFLLLFAYVLMVDFQPTPSWREYLIYFWLFSLVCEETRQVWQAELSLGGQRSRHSPLAAPGRSHTAHVPTLLLMSPPIPRGASTWNHQIPHL